MDKEHLGEDLRRDLLKSDTAAVYVGVSRWNDVQIPEINLELEAGTLEACMTQAAGKLLCGISLFDIYRSAQLGEGKKSLAFSLSFRADDRTLTDAEADRATAKVLAACEDKLGAVLRR